MLKNPSVKYRAFPQVPLHDRQWPEKTITKPPIWMSTDLRDGNQALFEPMNAERKLRMFEMLVKIGFKEIEAGFPSASDTDFGFIRKLVEGDYAGDDVKIEVLTQARPELISRTMESLRGAKNAIVHVYNATAPNFREVVFQQGKQGVKAIATESAHQIKEIASTMPETNWTFQYSPEVFSGTELDFAKEVVDAVTEIWEAGPERKVVINLPATVEMATPNIYADQIEWMCRNLDNRENLIVSVHPHNDRGTGIAAAEMGVLAGADRIEGTLFGNGERTGNVDIVTLALNMFTQGVDPELDCSDIERIKAVYEYSNQMVIPERHPYVGELVYTAFSGSHQDAINKGMKAIKVANKPQWEVPYLPIDPQDVGRTYEAIIRINSQSGKGGIAYIMQSDYGINMPRALQVAFREHVQKITDEEGRELPSKRIYDVFMEKYVEQPNGRIKFVDHQTYPQGQAKGQRVVTAEIEDNGVAKRIEAKGNGPVDGFINALSDYLGIALSVEDYSEHSLNHGSDAKAIAYVEVAYDGGKIYGVGINTNIVAASLEAIVSAANQILAAR